MADNSSYLDKGKVKRDNPLLGLLLNIGVPILVLMRFSGDDGLGPVKGLVVALAFPIGYGLYSAFQKGRFTPLSTLGIIGVVVTGGIGFFELDPRWVAVKEAAVPLVIGIGVVGSLRTRVSLARLILRNIIDLDRVDQELEERGTSALFERRLAHATYMVAGAFLVSAVLNYILARMIVVSPGGTTAFNEELGKMTALGFPVIAVPTMALFIVAIMFVLTGIRNLTGFDFKDLSV